MVRFISWATVSVALLCVSQVTAYANHTAMFSRRQTTDNGWDLNNKSYDYVIVGGGTAGLVLARRLSDDGKNTVAVIEAGNSGYDDNEKFVVPAAMLYDSGTGTQYDWQFHTTSQKQLNGKQVSWPRGKVLGGSSAINGLYYVRPSRDEVNAWADVAPGNAHDRWGWDNLLRAMKKSEKFQTPLRSVKNQGNIKFDRDSHGHNGPIHATWPGIMYEPMGAFIESTGNLGVDRIRDGYGGDNLGVYMALSSINKDNWERSFSRNEYLDPFSNRDNLHVLTGHTVTQVLFDRSDRNNVQATGVHYKASPNENEHTVHANKEVILCGGAINSPQLLQLSGIGGADLLNKRGVDVVVDLPGVGENLQDHVMAGMSFSVKNNRDMAPQRITGDKKRDSYVNSAIAYLGFDELFKDPNGFRGKIQDRANDIADEMNVDGRVKKGVNELVKKLADDMFYQRVSPIEILAGEIFGSLSIQAALQHPLSRGSVHIRNKNPFEYPRINPNYLQEDLDLTVLRQAFKFARKISQEPPLSNYIERENSPGSSVNTNEEWEDWIRKSATTEYHPSSTCSMLPRSKGGVVDSNLKVYGTSNLRVVDASVTPMAMSCHLEAVVYGIAEIAAEIILGN